jgi:protein O-GlcNAc transferase
VTSKLSDLGNLKRLPFGANTYLQSIETMKADQLDVLMLPDVGMTASSRILSQYRIAPVQLASWGHPVSTGSPNIDFFLSSDLMEPGNAQSHYSEKLMRLPNIGLYLEPGAYPPDPAALFDLPADRVVFGSLQSLFKYLPEYDCVYPRIAKQSPQSFFVFLELGASDGANKIFAERLSVAFAREQLDARDYVRFLPRMTSGQFASLCKSLHASVDSIGWTGGFTTIQCLEMDCPVVTLPGEFMRGRHSAAMLRMIGLDELIATSLSDFVDKVSQLALDPLYLAAIVKKITENKHKLYRDRSFIEAFDVFIKAHVLN